MNIHPDNAPLCVKIDRSKILSIQPRVVKRVSLSERHPHHFSKYLQNQLTCHNHPSLKTRTSVGTFNPISGAWTEGGTSGNLTGHTADLKLSELGRLKFCSNHYIDSSVQYHGDISSNIGSYLQANNVLLQSTAKLSHNSFVSPDKYLSPNPSTALYSKRIHCSYLCLENAARNLKTKPRRLPKYSYYHKNVLTTAFINYFY